MSIKTILVCLTTETSAGPLMAVAAGLARQHNAHLIGLHTIEALMVYPGIAMHVPGPAFATFNASQTEHAEAIRKIFDQHCKAEDFVSEWRLVKAESLTAADRIVESARAADLVVMAQADRDSDRADQSHIQQRLIRESGRPVLVVPLDGEPGEIGRNVVIGYSATREASRAAHDALDLMNETSEAHILRIASGSASDLADYAANELAASYARHGVKTNVVHREQAAGKSVSEMLLQEAFERGADLIVTGAFGHSRVYDFVIGAATRDLLRDADRPVLFCK